MSKTPTTRPGYGQAAPLYVACGWTGVLPIPSGKKQHPPRGFTGKAGADPDAETIDAWAAERPRDNIALRLPEPVLGIDVDAYDGKTGAQTLADAEADHGALPPTWRSTSRPDDPTSGIRLYRVPEGRQWTDLGTDVETIQRSHRYAVVWPSVHPDPEGRGYVWIDPEGNEASGPPSPGDLPELPTSWVERLTRPTGKRATPPAAAAPASGTDERTAASARAALEREVASVRAAVHGEREKVVCTQAAFNLGQWVGNGALDRGEVETAVFEACRENGWVADEGADHVRRKVAKAVEDGITKPRPNVSSTKDSAPDLADSPLAETTAARLIDRYCWASGLGWLRFDGRVWREATDANVTEAVRKMWRKRYADEIRRGADIARAKALTVLLTAARVNTCVRLLRGILERQADEFDVRADLLNVGNGVVDLTTGDLLPHDPDLLLTKITPVDYVPDAAHEDWAKALGALPDEVAEWMQARFGQAATGHPTSDDLLPVLQGNGANGKSTVVAAITAALGDHAVNVPERVLLSNPSDHPTELTTLRGARLALIEETPEVRHLNVKRLKDVVGTPTMTARRIRQDNVTWVATHSLFLTSNYRPRVNETDHGTWRRLALVAFPFTFRRPGEALRTEWDRQGDPALRERLRAGREEQHQAVLSWIVDGALKWYAAGRALPPLPQAVLTDTDEWRQEADLVLRYLRDRLIFDPDSQVLATELFRDFCEWQEGRGGGGKSWAENTFTQRFGDHDTVTREGVKKERTRRIGGLSRQHHRTGSTAGVSGGPVTVWSGLRFRRARDDRQGEL